ncbi:MAG TPA: hypothetical protein VFN67_19350 [Polyangiales bacterium]|nr:hypothetical protein [Polyangiales bacterium]
MKRGAVVNFFCYGVTLCVLLGLASATIRREYDLLTQGTEGRPYPATIYFVLPLPKKSAAQNMLPGATGADFSQVYTSARSLRAGQSAYLLPGGKTTDIFGRPAGYPPLMNWVYVPITRYTYVDALLFHTAFWAVVLVLVSGWFLSRMGLKRHWFPLSCMMTSLYFLTPIGYTHLERGQFDLVVATAAVLAMMCVVLPRNHFVLATIAGVLGALKWTAVSYLGCFAALGFLVSPWRRKLPFAMIPGMMAIGTFSFWQGVMEYWPTIQKYEINAEPNGVTFEWFLPRLAVKIIPVMLTLIVAGLIWKRGRSALERRQLLLAVAAPYAIALMCVSICFGTLSYEYHTVAMLGVTPGFVVWLERAPIVRERMRLAAAIGFAIFMPYAYRVFGFGDLYDPQTMTLLYAALASYMLFVCTVIVLRASPALQGAWQSAGRELAATSP